MIVEVISKIDENPASRRMLVINNDDANSYVNAFSNINV
jgi:translation elongation factor EF-Ts